MKLYKQWSINVLIISTSLIALLMFFNYIIDPLQFYRKAFYQPVFSDQQRFQNPGLAKNYDYDSIIIGSSMSENNIPSYVDKELGFKTLKLSIKGSSAKEQYLITKLAIETGKVKNIIWTIDYFSMRGDPTRVRNEYGIFPFYLYDNNLKNDYKYLLTLDTTKQIFNIIFIALGFKENKYSNLNLLNTWGDTMTFSRETVLKEWAKLKRGNQVTADEYEIAVIKQNIDQNVISLIRQSPNINFYLYYPPYSILQHRFYYIKNPVLFENELIMKRYVFQQIGKLPNVKIFDFQHESKITFNLHNYKDLAHHTRNINEWIINQISEGNYQVTENNLEKILQELKHQVSSLNEALL